MNNYMRKSLRSVGYILTLLCISSLQGAASNAQDTGIVEQEFRSQANLLAERFKNEYEQNAPEAFQVYEQFRVLNTQHKGTEVTDQDHFRSFLDLFKPQSLAWRYIYNLRRELTDEYQAFKEKMYKQYEEHLNEQGLAEEQAVQPILNEPVVSAVNREEEYRAPVAPIQGPLFNEVELQADLAQDDPELHDPELRAAALLAHQAEEDAFYRPAYDVVYDAQVAAKSKDTRTLYTMLRRLEALYEQLISRGDRRFAHRIAEIIEFFNEKIRIAERIIAPPVKRNVGQSRAVSIKPQEQPQKITAGTITLVGGDGSRIVLSSHAAQYSEYLRDLLEDFSEEAVELPFDRYNANELNFIVQILEGRSQGKPYDAIATELNKQTVSAEEMVRIADYLHLDEGSLHVIARYAAPILREHKDTGGGMDPSELKNFTDNLSADVQKILMIHLTSADSLLIDSRYYNFSKGIDIIYPDRKGKGYITGVVKVISLPNSNKLVLYAPYQHVGYLPGVVNFWNVEDPYQWRSAGGILIKQARKYGQIFKVSANGDWLMYSETEGGANEALVVWHKISDEGHWKLVKRIPTSRAQDGDLGFAEFTQNGKHLIWSTRTGIIPFDRQKVAVFDTDSGDLKPVRFLEEEELTDEIDNDPRGKYLVYRLGRSINVWDVSNDDPAQWEQVHTFKALHPGHDLFPKSMTFSPDGKYFAYVSSGNPKNAQREKYDKLYTIRIWDVSSTDPENWREVISFDGKGNIQFSPDGHYFSYIKEREMLVIMNASPGASNQWQELRTFRVEGMRPISYSSDGKTLLYDLGGDPGWQFLDMRDENPANWKKADFSGVSPFSRDVEFSRSSRHLFDKHVVGVRVWELANSFELPYDQFDLVRRASDAWAEKKPFVITDEDDIALYADLPVRFKTKRLFTLPEEESQKPTASSSTEG